MGCLMNVLWLVFGGILTAVEYMIASLLMMITIVGIPHLPHKAVLSVCKQ